MTQNVTHHDLKVYSVILYVYVLHGVLTPNKWSVIYPKIIIT
jgi:hypothetical protein